VSAKLINVKRVRPGLYFLLPTELGYAVGLVTHQTAGFGDVVWLAQPMFAEEPGIDDVVKIHEWRWPILLTVGPAIRQKVIDPIGYGLVPDDLAELPVFRFGDIGGTWRSVYFESGAPVMGAVIEDPSLPILLTVSSAALTEYLTTGWTPERWW
jgi:hypothetical protein